jgi:hypothetical protein
VQGPSRPGRCPRSFGGATAAALIAEAEAAETGENEDFKWTLVEEARAFTLYEMSKDDHVGLGTIIEGRRHGGHERGVSGVGRPLSGVSTTLSPSTTRRCSTGGEAADLFDVSVSFLSSFLPLIRSFLSSCLPLLRSASSFLLSRRRLSNF